MVDLSQVISYYTRIKLGFEIYSGWWLYSYTEWKINFLPC